MNGSRPAAAADGPFFAPPRRRFGQNFLRDRRVIERIVAAIDPRPGETVVEIGPGRGALTEPLLSRLTAQGMGLTVIEVDRDLVAYWQKRAEGTPLTVVDADARTVDMAAFPAPLVVVGNLPYNVSSPLLFHFARYHAQLARVVIMLQKEVVARLAAPPGSKTYGRLSVMIQRRFRVEPLFDVPPGAFWPVPKVVSSLVRLIPHNPDPYPGLDEARFAELVRAAFGQRRKRLANALKGLVTAEEIIAAGIDPAARAETVAVADFARLTAQLGSRLG